MVPIAAAVDVSLKEATEAGAVLAKCGRRCNQ